MRLRASLSAANGTIAGVNGTLSASSGVQYALSISPTINQTVNAGYTALLINVTETGTGSGAKKLADLDTAFPPAEAPPPGHSGLRNIYGEWTEMSAPLAFPESDLRRIFLAVTGIEMKPTGGGYRQMLVTPQVSAATGAAARIIGSVAAMRSSRFSAVSSYVSP